MKRFITIAALPTLTTAATAQEFSGKCTDYREKGPEACNATAWCVWRQPKPVTTPDGKQFTPKGSCAFKPQLGQAWAATTKQ